MATDKSLRQHYAVQGGGPNYLGKQKTVTAPKKWKSSPDHEPAELAYITKKEKDILIDLNLYGSLKDGKPNRGPSGIMSLQGDMGSIGGGSSGGGGGGGGGGGQYQDRIQRIAAQRNREQAAQRNRDAAIKAKRDIEAKQATKDKAYKEKRQREENAAIKAKRDIEAKQAAKDKAAKEKKQREEQEARSKEKGEALHGGPTVKEALKKAEIKKDIRDRQLEKMDVIPDDTTQLDLNKFGETITPEELPKGHPGRIEEESKEAVKQLSTKAGTKEALKEFKALDTGRRYTPDFDLLEKLGVKRPEGILSGLKKSFAPEGQLDLKKIALGAGKNLFVNKLMKQMGPLGSAINPALGVASLFGIDPIGWIMNKFSRKPRDMTAFNKLGLYDEGTPAAADTLTARGPKTTAEGIVSGEVDLNKLITGGESDKTMDIAFAPGSALDRELKFLNENPTVNPTRHKQLLEQDVEQWDPEKGGDPAKNPLSLPANVYGQTLYGADGGRAGHRGGGLINLFKYGGFLG